MPADVHGDTPIMLASAIGAADAVAQLSIDEAAINIPDARGMSPLMAASARVRLHSYTSTQSHV